ncbi:MAG: hypothetical protein P8Z30_11910 [Acidobacteriota bacterium]
MAIRLEKDGGLIFIRGGPDPPKKQGSRNMGLWLMLAVLVMGVVFASPLASGWPAISHTVHGFLAAVR